MRKINSICVLSVLYLLCAALTAYAYVTSTSGTLLEFSHSRISGSTTDSKPLYINKDLDVLTLEGNLTLKNGIAAIRITDEESSDPLWSDDYTESTEIQIRLTDLQGASELMLIVETTDCDNMKLTLTSSEKLVENVEKPEVADPEVMGREEKRKT